MVDLDFRCLEILMDFLDYQCQGQLTDYPVFQCLVLLMDFRWNQIVGPLLVCLLNVICTCIGVVHLHTNADECNIVKFNFYLIRHFVKLKTCFCVSKPAHET